MNFHCKISSLRICIHVWMDFKGLALLTKLVRKGRAWQTTLISGLEMCHCNAWKKAKTEKFFRKILGMSKIDIDWVYWTNKLWIGKTCLAWKITTLSKKRPLRLEKSTRIAKKFSRKICALRSGDVATLEKSFYRKREKVDAKKIEGQNVHDRKIRYFFRSMNCLWCHNDTTNHDV